jgi:uncharacterized protein
VSLLQIVVLLNLVLPKETLRYEYINKQVVDTSCGYSSVASLLSLYWPFEADEQTLLHTYAKRDDDTDSYSISLLEIERIILDHGLYCRSYRMDFDQLLEAHPFLPYLAHYDKPDSHYVCILGINRDFVIVGDPSSGVEIVDKRSFTSCWSGVVTLVASDTVDVNRMRLDDLNRAAEYRYYKLEKWAW